MSGTGRLSSGGVAARTRRGPRRPNGPACVVNTGSVRITAFAVRSRKVEWPTNVAAMAPGMTCAGGGGYGVSGTSSGHADLSRVRCHVMTSPIERACSLAGLKKRSPSQWSDTGSARLVRPKAELTKETRDIQFSLRFHAVVSHAGRAVGPRLPMFLAACALLAAIAPAAGAEPIASIPNPRVRDGTWVTDLPGVLRADTVARLNTMIGEVERASGVEMAVVVIKSLDGRSVEEVAVKLFELWGIGKKNKDNGLLLLWSTGDRRVRVEVGYGLEGALPDGKVGAILDTYVIPRFRSSEFDAGLLAGVDVLLRAVRNQPIDLPSAGSESYESQSGFRIRLLPWLT